MKQKHKFTPYWIGKMMDKLRNGPVDKFVNPILQSSPAMFAFDSIEELGCNQFHTLKSVCQKTKEIMESVSHNQDGLSQWDVFCAHAIKCNETERLKKIIRRLQYCYGDRLQEMGCSLEFIKPKKITYLCLHTKKIAQLEPNLIANNVKLSFASKVSAYVKSIVALIRWF